MRLTSKVATVPAALSLFVAGLGLGFGRPAAAPSTPPVALAALDGRQAPGLGEAEPSPAPPVARETRKPSGNPLWAVPLRTLPATRGRPLFSPSRRPPPAAVTAVPVVEEAAAPPPAGPERPALALVGTIIGGGEKIAIFFNTSSRAVIRLRLGEADNGWVLRSVGARETVLEKDRSSFTLALPGPEEAAPQTTPAPGAEEQL